MINIVQDCVKFDFYGGAFRVILFSKSLNKLEFKVLYWRRIFMML